MFHNAFVIIASHCSLNSLHTIKTPSKHFHVKIFLLNVQLHRSFLPLYCYYHSNRIYCQNANIVTSMGIDQPIRPVECKFFNTTDILVFQLCCYWKIVFLSSISVLSFLSFQIQFSKIIWKCCSLTKSPTTLSTSCKFKLIRSYCILNLLWIQLFQLFPKRQIDI